MLRLLLVTNNASIISMTNQKIDIENSILMGIEKEKENEYDYLIIDEDNLIIEDEQLLTPYKHKIAILGYTYATDYMFIDKDNFDINEIETYFEGSQEHNDTSPNNNEHDDYNEIIEKDQIILDVYNKLTAQDATLSTIGQEFNSLSDDIKQTLFLMLPKNTLSYMLKDKSIKSDYRRLIKKQVTIKDILKNIKDKLKIEVLDK